MNAGHASRSPESLTLVCFALRAEAGAFQSRLARRAATDAARRSGVEILLTGVGRPAAERALADAFHARVPTRVLSCGFAGALNPALRIGTVGFATEDAALRAVLLAAGARPMRFVTVDRVAVSTREKAALRRETGADAVEMESAALEAVCRERGVPFAVVRAVSDGAEEDLPLDFNRVLRNDGRLEAVTFLGALARRPATVVGLLRLQRQCRLASERLAEVLLRALGLNPRISHATERDTR